MTANGPLMARGAGLSSEREASSDDRHLTRAFAVERVTRIELA